jgi:pimeloyl-ACP methyl ester carboxylesterase
MIVQFLHSAKASGMSAKRKVLLRLVLTALAPLIASLPAPAAQPPLLEARTGALIRNGDSALHLVCTGKGAPTVVLEAGLGGNHLDWTLVQPELARDVTVCSYDRAGAGFSEPSSRPRTVDAIADELHRMIVTAALQRPIVLVGHSFGGLAALHFARRYPDEVAGLVLVDSMHPQQFERFGAAGVRLPDLRTAASGTPPAAAAYGLPERLQPLAVALASAPEARKTVIRESGAAPTNAETVRREGYPQVPARIIVHGNKEWNRVYPDGRMERAWSELQSQLAEALGAPPPIVASSSGHQIALDEPAAVVAAVRDLIASLAPQKPVGAGRPVR